MDIYITEDQATKIRAALSGLRYSGLVHSTRHIDNGVSLLQWLESYSTVVANAADSATEKGRELTQIKNDLASVGRLFALIQPASE
jgi:hypothetical protein